MRRLVWLCGTVVVLGLVGAFAVREVSVRAGQPLTSESDLAAIDTIEKTDQTAAPECAQLKRLALRAEVNALGVQLAHQSEPEALDQNVSELQASVHQLQAFAFTNPQVDRLRGNYAKLLQTMLASLKTAPAVAAEPVDTQNLDRRVQQVSTFNREQILFKSCQNL
ncbi:MAG: hypothetical protein HC805_04745 [Alkalinema sp. RL_2_19]|nr:hypothetical protein [Alkalinema sp. RL_2_19]